MINGFCFKNSKEKLPIVVLEGEVNVNPNSISGMKFYQDDYGIDFTKYRILSVNQSAPLITATTNITDLDPSYEGNVNYPCANIVPTVNSYVNVRVYNIDSGPDPSIIKITVVLIKVK